MPTLFNFFKKYPSPPVFQDEEQTRRAGIVYSIHLALILTSLAGILGELPRMVAGNVETTIILLVSNAIAMIVFWINSRGHPRLAGFILLTIMLFAVTALLLVGNGIHDIALTALPVLLILSALILDRRGVYFFTILVIGATFFVVFADLNDLPWFPLFFPTSTSYSDFFIVASILAIAAISSHFLIDQLVASLNRTRLSEARIRALVENSPDSILEIDRTGKIVFINRFVEMYLGKNVREVLPADQIRYALEVIEKAFISGEPQAIELQTTAPDGRLGWDSIRIGLVKQGNETTSLTIIMTEITAQKKAESAIRESEKRYRNSIITAGLVPYEIDYRQKRFTFIGDDIVKITGYTPAEFTPKILKESVQEDYVWGPNAKLTPDEARQSFLSGAIREWRSDMRILTRTGESRWLSDTSVEIPDETGKTQGAVGIFQDITERKRIEAERENLITELEKRNAELERFNYTLSHELKTPLVTIRGFLGFLEESLAKNNPARIKSDMTRIAKATDKMHAMINELLELARVGRALNPPEEISFEDVVCSALQAVGNRIIAQNVKVEIEPNLPLVYVDQPRLLEVLQNLLDNSLKYMGDQPDPAIRIGVRNENSPLTFFVQDNGMGIDSAYYERIFGLFDKLDPLSEGTGIGLTLIKRIITVHGGRVWVESEGLGKGSTFCFTIPDRQRI